MIRSTALVDLTRSRPTPDVALAVCPPAPIGPRRRLWTRASGFAGASRPRRTRLDATRSHRHRRSAAAHALRLRQLRVIETPRDLARSAAPLNGC